MKSWYQHQQLCLLQSSSQFRSKSREKVDPMPLLESVGAGFGAGLYLGQTSGPTIGALASLCAGSAVLLMGGGATTVSGVATSPGIQRFDVDKDGIVTTADRATALRPWVQSQQDTEKVWKDVTKTPFQQRQFNNSGSNSNSCNPSRRSYHHPALSLEPTKRPKADAVIAAMMAQSKFAAKVLSMGPMVITPRFVDRAIDKYVAFLQLAKDSPNECIVPTLDIDLIWHAHMLSPQDYETDVRCITGRLLSHDDQLGDGTLDQAFRRTKKKWHESYGVDYVPGGNSKKKGQITAEQQHAQCGVVPIFIPGGNGSSGGGSSGTCSEAQATVTPAVASSVDESSAWECSWETSESRWEADLLAQSDSNVMFDGGSSGDVGGFDGAGSASSCGGGGCGGGCGGGG